MKKIKVAQVLEATVGGTRTHLNLILTHIDRTKFDVTLICSTTRCQQSVADLERFRSSGFKVMVVDMVRSINPWKDLAGCWRMFHYLRRENFDLVHTHSSKAGVVGRLAAHLAGVPIIVHTPHAFAFQQSVSRLTYLLYVMVERLVGRWTDLMVCVSHDERQIALAAKAVTPAACRVIHNGIDLDAIDCARHVDLKLRRELDCGDDDLIVGSVADLRPQKGLKYLIGAAQRVLKACSRVKFFVVGSGDLIHELNRLISSCGIQNRFRFVAATEPIWKYYALMDIFVLPSLWEGLPYAVLEAMAMSKPVVATAVTGTREVIIPDKTGLLVPSRDEEALAAAVITLIGKPDLRRQMGANGRLVVESDFRIESKVKQLEAHYESLLQERETLCK